MTHQSRILVSSLRLALASLALTAGAAAHSDTYDTPDAYIGLNVGRTHLQLDDGFDIYDNDRRSRSYGVASGRYARGSNLGLEVGYTDFGKVDRAGGDTEAQGVHLALIARMPLGRSFNVLGKVGSVYSRTDVSAGPLAGVDTGEESGFDWMYGAGVELAFARQWSAVLQYDGYNLKFAGDERERVTNLALGLRFHY